MPRIRTIKPEFPQSESMGRVSREARLLFILLWTLVDDAGRTRAASRMLASLLYPYDDDAPKRIDGWLAELEAVDCIVRYQVGDATYLEVRNWLTHQKIDKPSQSKIPAFDESSRILANPRETSSGDLDRDQRTKGSKDQRKVPTEPCPAGRDRDAVESVFDHWKAAHGHPRAKLDPKRRKVIKAALATYPAEDLCEAISGYLNSPHHMGVNDRGTRYDDIELFLRDAKHVDMGLAFARNPPSNVSTLTRKIIANTEDWVPPEMRHGTA